MEKIELICESGSLVEKCKLVKPDLDEDVIRRLNLLESYD